MVHKTITEIKRHLYTISCRTRRQTVASIARDVGCYSTNRSSDIMHFLPRLLKKTPQHEQLQHR